VAKRGSTGTRTGTSTEAGFGSRREVIENKMRKCMRAGVRPGLQILWVCLRWTGRFDSDSLPPGFASAGRVAHPLFRKELGVNPLTRPPSAVTLSPHGGEGCGPIVRYAIDIRASRTASTNLRALEVITSSFASRRAFASTSSPPAATAAAPALMNSGVVSRLTPPVGTKSI